MTITNHTERYIELKEDGYRFLYSLTKDKFVLVVCDKTRQVYADEALSRSFRTQVRTKWNASTYPIFIENQDFFTKFKLIRTP